jgi:23S rRNA (cytosine1962-C5)-methyltransferase
VQKLNPLILHEDEHLLVINKPAGVNTHAPSPYAGEGIYEWLKNREPRWANLAIIHRLDKETSGVMVFGKTSRANQSLTEQFTRREVRKKYVLLTDRKVNAAQFTAKSAIVRAGEIYVSRPVHDGSDVAETKFKLLPVPQGGERTQMVEAEPLTGRTHQIRVHATANGFPILGDTLYGGTPAPRVFLHARELSFRHPQGNELVKFEVEPAFDADPRFQLRAAMIDFGGTNAFRVVHGAADGWGGMYVERFGDFLLAQSERDLDREQLSFLQRLMEHQGLRGIYQKKLVRRIRGTSIEQTSPALVYGEPASDEFVIRENGVQFAIRFNEGYSVGIFLDQRENRRRFLTNYVAPGFFIGRADAGALPLAGMTVLNTFAYTCGFSVCAAKAGAQVTSLDLSKKYLEWGKHNFELNDIDLAQHDFIYGDTFDWLRRLAKKNRLFDVIVLDPPTFSQSKEHGMFRAEKDYGALVSAALGVLKEDGILLCSTNAADLAPEKFLKMIGAAVRGAKRKIGKQHFVPQPVDFPISRSEPAYLKTCWFRVK